MSRVYLSTSCIKSDRIDDAVRRLASITRHIELSGGSRYRAGSLALLRSAKAELGLDFLLHGYFPPPPTDFVLNFADGSAATRQFVARAIRHLLALEVPYYSVHAGFKQNFRFEGELLVDGEGSFCLDDIGANLRWFRRGFPQVPLAIENLYPNNGNVDSCFATTVEEIDRILDYDGQTLLLLDLGHLQISAHHLGFDWQAAANDLISRHAGRIVEIHLTENAGVHDDHDLISAGSPQYHWLQQHKETMARYHIRLTIEARGKDLAALAGSYALVRSIIEEEA
jgi:hypothetical protein